MIADLEAHETAPLPPLVPASNLTPFKESDPPDNADQDVFDTWLRREMAYGPDTTGPAEHSAEAAAIEAAASLAASRDPSGGAASDAVLHRLFDMQATSDEDLRQARVHSHNSTAAQAIASSLSLRDLLPLAPREARRVWGLPLSPSQPLKRTAAGDFGSLADRLFPQIKPLFVDNEFIHTALPAHGVDAMDGAPTGAMHKQHEKVPGEEVRDKKVPGEEVRDKMVAKLQEMIRRMTPKKVRGPSSPLFWGSGSPATQDIPPFVVVLQEGHSSVEWAAPAWERDLSELVKGHEHGIRASGEICVP